MDDFRLVCMLADAPLMIPGSDFTHSCGTCGRRVMVAPIGLAFLAKTPHAQILCNVCLAADNSEKEIRLPGPLSEMIEEVGRAVPNLRRQRN